MKKISAFSLAVLAASVLSTSAHAAEQRWPNWYVGLNAGWVDGESYDLGAAGAGTSVSTKDGYILGGSIGYVPPTQIPFLNMTRYELEYTYRDNNGKTAGFDSASSSSAMFNVLVDFYNESNWTPYVGAGAGYSWVSFDSGLGDISDSTFAWQLLAGLEYEPESIPMTAWGIRYRYFDAGKVSDSIGAGSNLNAEYDTHSIEATARFRF